MTAAADVYQAITSRPGSSMHYSQIAALCDVHAKTVHTYLADWTNPTYADPRFPGIRRDGGGYYTYVAASTSS